MDRTVARVGAWAGWIGLVGIMGYHLALTIAAGQRVSGTMDAGLIRAYYGQGIVAVAGVEQFLVIIPMAVFAVAMRMTLGDAPIRKLLTGVALVALIAELAVILTQIAVQAGLVAAVQAQEPVVGLFRYWDALYNSGAYVLEATWVFAFGLAMRGVAPFPRFLSWFSPLTALLLGINVFAIWIGIPDAATLPSSVFLAIWLGGASFGLRRASSDSASNVAVLQAGAAGVS